MRLLAELGDDDRLGSQILVLLARNEVHVTLEPRAVATRNYHCALGIATLRLRDDVVGLVLHVVVRRLQPVEQWRERLDARVPAGREANRPREQRPGLAASWRPRQVEEVDEALPFVPHDLRIVRRKRARKLVEREVVAKDPL